MPPHQSKTWPGSNGSGDDNTFVFENIRNVFLKRFPELWERIEATFGSYYDLKSEIPEAYPLFEDILQERVIELLKTGADEDSLKRIFSFYEDMAKSEDEDVVTLLSISIMEDLVYDKNLIAEAWKYMGEKTKNMAREIARSQGWEENLPSTPETPSGESNR
jgi:hypothetical protein